MLSSRRPASHAWRSHLPAAGVGHDCDQARIGVGVLRTAHGGQMNGRWRAAGVPCTASAAGRCVAVRPKSRAAGWGGWVVRAGLGGTSIVGHMGRGAAQQHGRRLWAHRGQAAEVEGQALHGGEEEGRLEASLAARATTPGSPLRRFKVTFMPTGIQGSAAGVPGHGGQRPHLLRRGAPLPQRLGPLNQRHRLGEQLLQLVNKGRGRGFVNG